MKAVVVDFEHSAASELASSVSLFTILSMTTKVEDSGQGRLTGGASWDNEDKPLQYVSTIGVNLDYLSMVAYGTSCLGHSSQNTVLISRILNSLKHSWPPHQRP
ncbi:unnamed protein product [Protopolystoma xenopodis]|uniref:Uncharacterized protein n=1 Tax=Protopolystoma xenopodis TaxID=117903 RepID=A0A3S5BQH6_9PLAT|nr:unnamed protein product [Protopolystoma xenopodis]